MENFDPLEYLKKIEWDKLGAIGQTIITSDDYFLSERASMDFIQLCVAFQQAQGLLSNYKQLVEDMDKQLTKDREFLEGRKKLFEMSEYILDQHPSFPVERIKFSEN